MRVGPNTKIYRIPNVYIPTQESYEIYLNRCYEGRYIAQHRTSELKNEEWKPDHERQTEHEVLLHLSENNHKYRIKKLDSEELQVIEMIDAL